MHAADRANLLQRLAALLEQNDVLVIAGAERLHEPAALSELLDERCRHARVRGCDSDRVEGRDSRHACRCNQTVHGASMRGCPPGRMRASR